MIKKTEYNTFIISAGEVASYSVCPKAWALTSLTRTRTPKHDNVAEGAKRHTEWAKHYDEYIDLGIAIRLVACLSFLATLIYALK